jgi:hypothetical protein
VVVLAVIVVLLVTNIATAAALVRRRRGAAGEDVHEMFPAPRPPGVSHRHRRLITVEILNPLELAATRGGRIAGLAGSLAPGLTRRVVYDQTLKTLRSELGRMAVHADVRLHTLRAVPRPLPAADPAAAPVVDAAVVDEVAPLDLSRDN